MSISNNVVAGLKLEGTRNRDKSEMKVEKELRLTHL